MQRESAFGGMFSHAATERSIHQRAASFLPKSVPYESRPYEGSEFLANVRVRDDCLEMHHLARPPSQSANASWKLHIVFVAPK